VLAVFRKLPNTISLRIAHKRRILITKHGSKINKVVNWLAQHSGAIYVHIIHYHNGKVSMKKKYVLDKMTVEWEELGRVCHNCITKCRYTGVEPLQDQWDNVAISEGWREIMTETINLEGLMSLAARQLKELL
jgi:hypothetical protein